MPTGRPEDVGRPVDYYATAEHYLDHLAPVWRAQRNRGRFYCPEHLHEYAVRLGIAADPLPADLPPGGPVAVAAYADIEPAALADRHIVLFEHGAGFAFDNWHPCYAGGRKLRCCVRVFACPNQYVAARNRATYPEAHVYVVGSPKMDAVFALPAKRPEKPPLVAIAFHWECLVAPETRSAYPHYAEALPELAERFRLLGHAHPRERERMRAVFEGLGVEFAERFEEVLERADCYVNDASSTLYEFAATGRPVVVLNAPWYRREVHHGLRFWEYADIGPQVDEPQELGAAVELALRFGAALGCDRDEAMEAVWTYCDGSAAARAAHLLDHLPQAVEGRPLPPLLSQRLTEGRSEGDRGAVCVALDESQRALATRTAESLRALHPDLPVALLGREPAGWEDRFVAVGADQPDEVVTRLVELSPWQQTVYLEAGSEVVGSLAGGFAALDDGFDLALAIGGVLAEGSADEATVQALGTDELFRWRTELLFLRRSPATERFSRRWQQELGNGGGLACALLRALHAEPLRLWPLAPQWAAPEGARHVRLVGGSDG